jgi:2-dehydro-3-deoxygalactonokinase
MNKILSCDWGTSALRLRLVDVSSVSVLAETTSLQGISGIFELWKKTGKPENERISFYHSVLNGQIINLEQQLNTSLNDIPVIISGMACSDMGMAELPYKEIPLHTGTPDLTIKNIEASDTFRHAVLLISGVKTKDDVMRGEETQLIGCIDESSKEGEQLFIFPGTHSKHVAVEQGQVTDIKTYMTGEFFELLSTKSILSNSVKKDEDFFNPGNLKSFEKGVSDSQDSNLLHSSFFVRTNDLLGKLSTEENYYYLSGLLIGTELKEIANAKMLVTVVCNKPQMKFYGSALNKLGITGLRYYDTANAVIKGHCKMYSLCGKNLDNEVK